MPRETPPFTLSDLRAELRKMADRLDQLAVSLNSGEYMIEDSDTCVLVGRIRAADAVIRDTMKYCEVI